MILGIFLILLGTALIAFSGQLTGVVGRRDRADRHLGGTTQGFVIIGFGIIVLGGFVMFGGETNPQTPTLFPGTTLTGSK